MVNKSVRRQTNGCQNWNLYNPSWLLLHEHNERSETLCVMCTALVYHIYIYKSHQPLLNLHSSLFTLHFTLSLSLLRIFRLSLMALPLPALKAQLSNFIQSMFDEVYICVHVCAFSFFFLNIWVFLGFLFIFIVGIVGWPVCSNPSLARWS